MKAYRYREVVSAILLTPEVFEQWLFHEFPNGLRGADYSRQNGTLTEFRVATGDGNDTVFGYIGEYAVFSPTTGTWRFLGAAGFHKMFTPAE